MSVEKLQDIPRSISRAAPNLHDAPRGQRLRVAVPYGHWRTTTFVGALSMRRIIAPFVLDGPINREAFETYVERVLVPTLRPGDVVVMDNLSSHKGRASKT